MNKENKKFDLEERTLEFSKKILGFARTIPKNAVTIPLISQLVRAGTSVGSNYREANEALSKKDFTHRIRICRKEAKETRYWLNLIIEVWPEGIKEGEFLLQEAKEFILIFFQIIKSSESH